MREQEQLTKSQIYKLYQEGRIVVLPSSSCEAVILHPENMKHPLQSKTINSTVVLLVLLLNQTLGLKVPEETIGQFVYGAAAVIAAGFAIYGRFKADKTLQWRRKDA